MKFWEKSGAGFSDNKSDRVESANAATRLIDGEKVRYGYPAQVVVC